MLLWSNFKKVSESLEKTLKQQNTETGKRKRREKRVNFSSSDDEDDQVEEVEPDDSFVCELDQLSLSDADLNDLEELKPGRTFRKRKWQDRKTI